MILDTNPVKGKGQRLEPLENPMVPFTQVEVEVHGPQPVILVRSAKVVLAAAVEGKKLVVLRT